MGKKGSSSYENTDFFVNYLSGRNRADSVNTYQMNTPARLREAVQLPNYHCFS